MSQRTKLQRLADESRNLLQAGVVLLAVGTVLGLLAGLSLHLTWFADFRQIYLIGALLPLVVFARRSTPTALTAAAIIVVNAGSLLPYAPTAMHDCAPELTALSINAFADFSDHDKLLEQLRAEDADVIAICELTPQLKARVTRLYPHVVDAGSVAIFSQFPIQRYKVRHTVSGRPYINAVLSTPRGDLRVLAAHARVPLSHDGALERADHLETLGSIAASSSEPVLLLGDLNATMFSPDFEPLHAGGLHSVREGRGVLATWPAISPLRIAIDHVMHSDELEVCDVEVGESFGSDHLPLKASLAWRPSPQSLVL